MIRTERKAVFLIFFILLLLQYMLPVTPHDWGDDFALYMMQTAQYAGNDAYNNLFIYHTDAPLYSPPVYPPGLPVLLLPVYLVTGINIPAMQLYMFIWLFVVMVLVFYLARKIPLPFSLSLLAACIIGFHTFSLLLRCEILSDIPFTACLLFWCWAYTNKKSPYLIAALAIAAMLIRTIGIILPVIWIADILLQYFLYKNSFASIKKQLHGWWIGVAGMLIALYVFPVFLIHTGTGKNISAFSVYENCRMYNDVFTAYVYELFKAPLLLIEIIKGMIVLLFAWGSFIMFKKKQTMYVLFAAGYLLILLIYPYSKGGFRLLFPVIPFILTGMLVGIHSIFHYVKRGRMLTVAFSAVTGLLLIAQSIRYSVSPAQVNAVETRASHELFAAIKKNVPAGSIIVSTKPRALCLFTQRKGMFIDPSTSIEKWTAIQKKYNPGYVVTVYKEPNAFIDEISRQSSLTEIVWQNKKFRLCRIKD